MLIVIPTPSSKVKLDVCPTKIYSRCQKSLQITEISGIGNNEEEV